MLNISSLSRWCLGRTCVVSIVSLCHFVTMHAHAETPAWYKRECGVEQFIQDAEVGGIADLIDVAGVEHSYSLGEVLADLYTRSNAISGRWKPFDPNEALFSHKEATSSWVRETISRISAADARSRFEFADIEKLSKMHSKMSLGSSYLGRASCINFFPMWIFDFYQNEYHQKSGVYSTKPDVYIPHNIKIIRDDQNKIKEEWNTFLEDLLERLVDEHNASIASEIRALHSEEDFWNFVSWRLDSVAVSRAVWNHPTLGPLLENRRKQIEGSGYILPADR